jgi:hypothetical protein
MRASDISQISVIEERQDSKPVAPKALPILINKYPLGVTMGRRKRTPLFGRDTGKRVDLLPISAVR